VANVRGGRAGWHGTTSGFPRPCGCSRVRENRACPRRFAQACGQTTLIRLSALDEVRAPRAPSKAPPSHDEKKALAPRQQSRRVRLLEQSRLSTMGSPNNFLSRLKHETHAHLSHSHARPSGKVKPAPRQVYGAFSGR